MNLAIGYFFLIIVLISFELLYFRLAERFQIIDKPNQRSSHSQPTIRGAGIIFPIVILIWFSFYFSWQWFVLGALFIAIVSFADDLKPVSSVLRVSTHVLAMLLLFYQLSLFEWPVLLLSAAFIISVGALSAFNFMDGINGITGLYALVNFITFFAINMWVTVFTDSALLIFISIAVLIFLFFNLRKKARCFSGDVGSVSLAFVQIFLMFQLISTTDNLMWVGVCLVFGVDAVLTIIDRIRLGENIFKPHRQHVYQYLSNELGWSHNLVSIFYVVLQFLINLIIVFAYLYQQFWIVPALIVTYSICFMGLRIAVIKKVKLRISRQN